jgi:PST family polysaccharide transporter
MIAGKGTSRDSSTKKALAFVYVGYAFRYLYLLVLVPFYGRVLGAAEYGRVLAAMSLFQFVWMLSEYGFPSVGMRDIALDQTPRGSAEVYAKHTSARLMMTMVGLAVGAIGTVASPLLRERPIFGVLATLTGVMSAFNLGWYFQGTLRFRTSVLVEIFGFAVNLVCVLSLVRGKSDGWIVLASLFGSSVMATAVAHFIALRSMDRTNLRWGGSVQLVRESTALFAARGLALVTSSSSTFLIALFADAKQVGWYGAAERLATAGLSLMQPANQVLIGTIAGLMGSTATERAAFRLIRRGLVVLTSLGGAMLVGTMALAGIAVPMILGPEFGPSVRMLRILAVMFPFAAFSQVVTGYVLVPLRFDRFVTASSLVGALVTVALTVGLGRAFEGEGVAWARVVGAVSMCVLLVYVVWRERLAPAIVGPRNGEIVARSARATMSRRAA